MSGNGIAISALWNTIPAPYRYSCSESLFLLWIAIPALNRHFCSVSLFLPRFLFLLRIAIFAPYHYSCSESLFLLCIAIPVPLWNLHGISKTIPALEPYSDIPIPLELIPPWQPGNAMCEHAHPPPPRRGYSSHIVEDGINFYSPSPIFSLCHPHSPSCCLVPLFLFYKSICNRRNYVHSSGNSQQFTSL